MLLSHRGTKPTRARRSPARAPPARRPCRSPRSGRPAPTSRRARPRRARRSRPATSARSCAWRRSRVRSAPTSGAWTTCPRPSPPSSTTPRSTSRRPLGCCSSSAAAPNAWVAAEGALKIRETAYVAAAGYSMEYLLHGPSVAVGGEDALVVLDRRRARPGAPRPWWPTPAPATARSCTASAATRSASRSRSSRSRRIVQRIALEAAERLGTNPDSFGKDLPGRAEVWAAIPL